MSEAMQVPLDVRLMNGAAAMLLLLAATMALGAGLWWALRHPVFSIAGITVTGDVAHNSALTLRANVAPRLTGSFFTVDLAQTRQAFEAVPWVRRAVVQRDFPNRLKVSLQEHQAVALWGSEAEPRIVNSFGEVFDANPGDVEQDDLPRLNGPDARAAAQVLSMYRSLKPEFERIDLGLEQLMLTGRGNWQAVLDSGGQIELGRGTPAELIARVRRFAQTVTQVTSKYGRRTEAVESADLRHGDGYAVRLRGVTTVADSLKKSQPVSR